MKKLMFLITFMVFVLNTQAISQTYYLNLEAGVGYARYITDMNQTGLNQNGIIGSFRVMWQRDIIIP